MNNERYNRNTLLPGWTQNRLTQSTVIIMGMGALGNVVSQSLALAGVGHLILCDMDRIELSNLSRAPLFKESDIGEYKVDAASRSLSCIAPDSHIDTRNKPFEYAIGLSELRDADLIIGCLDSRSARRELAGRCGLVSAPWIDGATGEWSGEIRPYLDLPDGPCYGCGLSDETRAISDLPRSCRVQDINTPDAATAPLSMIVGAQMSLIAVRWLMNLEVKQDILVLDGLTGEIYPVKHQRSLSCPYHHPISSVKKISLNHKSTVAQLKKELENDAHPLTWKPFQVSAHCRKCGVISNKHAVSKQSDCPNCKTPLFFRTQLDIFSAPDETTLKTLGIPPGEILPVKMGEQITYVELVNFYNFD
ncbi:MAG: UBA/THIF-type NAD/FAD binding protein [Candidatus Magnetoglobus multicellularis str. Araruama]|uniref:UBA/THIF-type NAD/FAD binding protein n=1 Tax=Candidatus Magnetoglobus multicellularis str. Araruama TaxID=890399 RepID=A0A1V1NWV6_9BACT|nr:MAG: UBA/THIF-type NAD/FAD binding protein [Candidatus Magnetoglobus multicellularis str. Araruama]